MTKRPFSQNLKVGFQDRGMGRGDFGIIDDKRRLIARLEATHIDPEVGIPTRLDQVTALPDLENATLFAAAPDLYEACVLAEKKLWDPAFAPVAKILRAALKKARVPNRKASR